MPLSPIPSDPVPAEAELQAILARPESRTGNLRSPSQEVARRFARITWKVERRAEDPNAFVVPFSTDPQAFGSKEAYERYRQGDAWKAQRKRVLDRAGGKCEGCGRKATQVHHRDYRPRVIAGDDDTPLVALCRTCHRHLHAADARGIEPSWQESEARLARLVVHREGGPTILPP